MELSFLLVEQILSMVLMALAGFVIGRLKLVTEEGSRALSCVCIYLVVPCSLITSFGGGERDGRRLEALAVSLAAAAVLHGMYLILNWLLSRGSRGLGREEQVMVMYNNAGNLIIPMVQSILGREYVLYTSPYILVQNLFMWTHGQRLLGGAEKLTVKKVLSTPAIAAILAGLFLYGTGIRLPGPLETAMTGMAGCMAPVSMLVVGLLISDLNLKEVLLSRRVYWVAVLRLIFYPLLSMGVLLVMGRLWQNRDGVNVLTVILLCSIGPTASATTQMAQLFRNPKGGYVSAGNVVTTLLCAVTMPALATIFLAWAG